MWFIFWGNVSTVAWIWKHGEGHSLFRPVPVRGSVCLCCGFDTHSRLKNWNKQTTRELLQKVTEVDASVFERVCFATHGISGEDLKRKKLKKKKKEMTVFVWPDLWILNASQLLLNYHFLSQGHSGMRSKMDYVPTLALTVLFYAILTPFLFSFSSFV